MPADVREFHRVSRNYVLLLIAPRAEITKVPNNRLKALARKAISAAGASGHAASHPCATCLGGPAPSSSTRGAAGCTQRAEPQYPAAKAQSPGNLAAGSLVAPPERVGLLSAYVIATLVAPARELFCLSSSSLLMKVELLLLLSLERGAALLVDSQRRRLITLLRVQLLRLVVVAAHASVPTERVRRRFNERG